jgi:L-ascorbate metabolism protein UlaG (beta-lactamase superfamily)
LLRATDSASRNPSTSHHKETPDDVSESLHVAWHVQKDKGAAVHAGDTKVLSLAYVIGSIARQVLLGVSCDAYRMCLTPEAQCFNIFQRVE